MMGGSSMMGQSGGMMGMMNMMQQMSQMMDNCNKMMQEHRDESRQPTQTPSEKEKQ